MSAEEGAQPPADVEPIPSEPEPESLPASAELIASAALVQGPARVDPAASPTGALAATGPSSIPAAGEFWARVLRSPGVQTVLRTLMSYLRPVSIDLDGGRIVLAGAGRYAESARGRLGQLAEVCRRELGRPIEVVIQADGEMDDGNSEDGAQDAASGQAAHGEAGHAEELGPDTETAPVQEAPQPVAPARPPATVPSQHPLVKEAMELFGARIVDVQFRRPSA